MALVLHEQAIDTTTPAGRMLFQITGAVAEFERGTSDPQPRQLGAGPCQGACGVRLGRPKTGAKVEAVEPRRTGGRIGREKGRQCSRRRKRQRVAHSAASLAPTTSADCAARRLRTMARTRSSNSILRRPTCQRKLLQTANQPHVAADRLSGLVDTKADQPDLQFIADVAQSIEDDALLPEGPSEDIVHLVEQQALEVHGVHETNGDLLEFDHRCPRVVRHTQRRRNPVVETPLPPVCRQAAWRGYACAQFLLGCRGAADAAHESAA